MRINFLAKNLRSIGHVLVGLCLCLPANAIDSRLFLRLYSLEELATNSEIQSLHYQALQSRFSNDDFDEVLFVGQKAESARLSIQHHRLMLEAINKFAKAANYAEPEAFLSQRPQYPIFSLVPDQAGGLHSENLKLPASDIGLWLNNMRSAFWNGEFLKQMSESTREEFVRLVSKRNAKVKSIFDLKPATLAQDSELMETCLRAYMDLSRKDKSQNLLQSAAVLVVAKWMQENKIIHSKFNFAQLTDLDSQFLKMRMQAELVPILKAYQLPSRLVNNFFKEAGLNESAASPFPKNQVVVMPLTKWEAMFKGIGPGECIRASANRFFDAFYPFSQAFAILKDGKELGYIGIYKINQRMSERKLWYIDTLQSPALVQDNGDSKILDAIMDQLERWAIKEGAMLAIPVKDWNGTNYKENIPRIHTRGSLAQVEVAFPGSDLLNGIFEFVAHKDQEHHQQLMSNSHYTDNKIMYDTLLRNEYNVRILEPSQRLSESERAQYFRNFGRGLESSMTAQGILRQFEDLGRFGVEHPTNRLRMLQIYQENKLYFMNSANGRMLAQKYLFAILIKAFGSVPETGEIQNILQRVHAGDHAKVPKQSLLLELLPFVPNELEATRLIRRLARAGIEPEQVVDFVLPVLDKLNFKNWLQIYPILLKQMPDAFADFAMASEIVQRLDSPESFVRFTAITEGRLKGQVAAYSDQLTRLLVTHFTRILRKIENSDSRFQFLSNTKDFTRAEHDPALVTAYVLNVRSYAEFKRLEAEIVGASKLYDDNVRSQMSARLLSSSLEMNSQAEVMEMTKLLNNQGKQELLKKAEVISRVIQAAGTQNLLNMYDDFLNSARTDAQDILVNERFAPYISNTQFESWLAYASGEKSKSIFATAEKRKFYFVSELVRRLQSESDSTLAAKMIQSLAKRFGYLSLFSVEGGFASALDLGNRSEARKILLAHAISENMQGALNAKGLYEVAMNLLRLSNYELDISDLFAQRPAIGLRILEALKNEGHQVSVSEKALQYGSQAFYLLKEEREEMSRLLNPAAHEISCQLVFE